LQDDVHITPGFTIKELSPDLAFEPELSCYKWTQTLKLRFQNHTLVHELEDDDSTVAI
jgi:hypothetical protein